MIISVWPNSQHQDGPDCDGQLHWAGGAVRCALGRAGLNAQKQEGDGRTPVGRFPLRRVFYRPDRVAEPATALSVIPIEPAMGWCDEPTHPDYNTLVHRPFAARHERLWRTDSRYDVVVEVGYNDDPVVPHHGSAIFMHVAHPQYQPTEGCVALALVDLLELLKQCDQHSLITIDIKSPGPAQ